MGHGIDAALFSQPSGENDPPEVLMVGRLAHIKRQDWLLRAAARVMASHTAGPFRVVIAGGPVEGEPEFPPELEHLARTLDPAPPVTFTGPLPHAEVAATLRGCAVAVNLSPPGLSDKAALEAMLAGRPTLVTNSDFLPLLGDSADLLYVPENAGDGALADRLARLLALTPAERMALGAQLRERALAAHSLDGLMDRLAALMREVMAHG